MQFGVFSLQQYNKKQLQALFKKHLWLWLFLKLFYLPLHVLFAKSLSLLQEPLPPVPPLRWTVALVTSCATTAWGVWDMNMCAMGRWTALTAPMRRVAAPSALRVSGARQGFNCVADHFWVTTHQQRNAILLLFKCFWFWIIFTHNKTHYPKQKKYW